jgi:hypothetical protein
MDYQLLKNELNKDPKGLGYAQYIATGNDVYLAAKLNDPAGPGAELITIAFLPRAKFLFGMASSAIVLAGKDTATQNKWDRLLGFAQSVDSIEMASPVIQGILQYAMADGLVTQEQVDGFSKRKGSRAEVLFGENTTVTHTDVAIALRSTK